MKLGPKTKLDKRNTATSKNFDGENFDGSRIPDARSTKLTFSLKVTCYLTKTENKTKKSFNTAVTLLL